MKKIRLCRDCVNFIEEENNKITCDFLYFENEDVYKALIYIPEQFDCQDYEVV